MTKKIYETKIIIINQAIVCRNYFEVGRKHESNSSVISK